MKPAAESTCRELSSSTWNLEQWIQLDLVHLDNYFDQIILFLDKVEQEITGQRVITRKVRGITHLKNFFFACLEYANY